MIAASTVPVILASSSSGTIDCRASPGLEPVVPGVKNAAEIEDAVAALQQPGFSDEQLDRIRRIGAGEEDDT